MRPARPRAARSSSPPTTVKGNGTPASHSPAYAGALLVLPTSSQPAVGQLAQVPQRGPDPVPDLAEGCVEDDVGVVLPALAEVGLQLARGVEVGGHVEGPLEQGDLGDPVDAEGAQRLGVVGEAEQVPPSVAHHDRPRVDLERARVAGRGAVAEAHRALRVDGRDEVAGDARVRLGRRPLGDRAGGLAQGDRLPGDVGRQHPQDLPERRADRVVGIGDRVLGVERRHHQAERLRRAEHQWRQAQPAAQPVATVGAARRLHRDVGLAQDRDVAPRGPLGDAEALGELGGRDPGAALEDVQRPERPCGRADLARPACVMVAPDPSWSRPEPVLARLEGRQPRNGRTPWTSS